MARATSITLERLERLAETYSGGDPRRLLAVARERIRRRELALLDLAALAADLTLNDLVNLSPSAFADAELPVDSTGTTALEANLDGSSVAGHDSLVMVAFSRANGGMNPEALNDMTPEQLEGVLANTKGHYFEALVVDRLNNGEALGEVRLEEGQTAVLADSPNQPDWDVRILNEDGTTDEVLQLKATESMGSISESLRENPDIRVVTTSDIDSAREGVLPTDISNDDLKADVSSELGTYSSGNAGDSSEAVDAGAGADTGETAVADAGGGVDAGGAAVASAGGGVDAGGTLSASGDNPDSLFTAITNGGESEALEMASEIALDALPVVSGVAIVVIEGRRVIIGSVQLQEALARGSKRLGTAAVFTTAGAAMTAAGAPGVVVVPPLIAARVLLSRYGNRATMGTIAKEHADTLTALRQQPLQ